MLCYIFFLLLSISFHVKAKKFERDRVMEWKLISLIIPLTNLEQWPVPSDVDSRHNPDGGHLSKATPLYFSLYFYLYFSLHWEPALPYSMQQYQWGCPAGLIDRRVLRVGTPQ